MIDLFSGGHVIF